MDKEIWKPIKGYENVYEVSNLGNVRSVDRYYEQNIGKNKNVKRVYKGKILKQFKSNAGYMRVQLSYKYKSIPKTVHKLVAETWRKSQEGRETLLKKLKEYKLDNEVIGYTPNIDGNKENNKVTNLEWCTYSHNNKEAIRNGLNKGFSGTTYKKRCKLAIEYIKKAYQEDEDNKIPLEDLCLKNCTYNPSLVALSILQGEKVVE